MTREQIVADGRLEAVCDESRHAGGEPVQEDWATLGRAREDGADQGRELMSSEAAQALECVRGADRVGSKCRGDHSALALQALGVEPGPAPTHGLGWKPCQPSQQSRRDRGVADADLAKDEHLLAIADSSRQLVSGGESTLQF